MSEWLTHIGPYKVEKMPVPRANGKTIRRNMTGAGVLHTAEGSSVSSMVSTLKAKGGAAYTFAVAPNRIIQLRALNDQSSALRGDQNRFAQVQIVMVNSVPSTPAIWLPQDDILQPLIHLLKWFSQGPENIPLIEPVADWPSDWSDFKGKSWATNNVRRKQAGRSGRWPNVKGWFTHVEIPNQAPTWHHDCYALNRKRLLEMAAALPFVSSNQPISAAEPVPPVESNIPNTPPVSAEAAAEPTIQQTINTAPVVEAQPVVPTQEVAVKKESPSMVGRALGAIGVFFTGIGAWFQTTGIDLNAAIANGSAGKVLAIAAAIFVKLLPVFLIGGALVGVYYLAIWRAQKRENIAAKTAADTSTNSVTFKG